MEQDVKHFVTQEQLFMNDARRPTIAPHCTAHKRVTDSVRRLGSMNDYHCEMNRHIFIQEIRSDRSLQLHENPRMAWIDAAQWMLPLG
jgi:hypothetical protein